MASRCPALAPHPSLASKVYTEPTADEVCAYTVPVVVVTSGDHTGITRTHTVVGVMCPRCLTLRPVPTG